jgi:O6-methylguanine-DNA--protein-cysteine methyltransferase
MHYKSLEKIAEKNILDLDHLRELAPSISDMKSALSYVGVVGAAGMAGLIGGALKNRFDTSKVKQGILDLEQDLHKEYSAEDMPKAKARLFEIARVAPHVTQNKDLTKSIISSKLHNGLSSDDKQSLVLLQSQYHKDPNVESFMPKMASSEVGEILADVIMIKQASFGDSLKTIGLMSALPIAAGVAGGLVNLALEKIKQKDLKGGLEQSFTHALSLSDHDREPLLQNKEKAREAFNTLARFSPAVALDPQAARAFMNKIVSYDQGIDIGTVKELSEISKNLSTIRSPNSFGEGFAATSHLTGAQNIISRGVGKASTSLAGRNKAD